MSVMIFTCSYLCGKKALHCSKVHKRTVQASNVLAEDSVQ